MVKAEIRNQPVAFDGLNWKVEDPGFRAELETFERIFWATSPGYVPDRARRVVQFVIDEIGGRIVSAATEPGEPGAIY